MRSVFSLILLAAAAAAAPAAPAEATDATTDATDATAAATSRYVVILKDEVSDVTTHLDSLHLPNVASALYEGAIKGYTGEFNAAALALIRADPMMHIVQADQQMTGFAEERFSGYGLGFSSQALRLAQGTSYSYYYSRTGRGVVVYVADSGVTASVPDFQGRAVNAANFVTRQYGMADEPNTDTHGHGTAVSGCVAGNEWGTAKGASIQSLKVLDYANRGTTSAIVAAVNYAINNCNGRKCVLNLSLGGPEDSALDYAVFRSNAAGITTVVAAGNDNRNACQVSPAGSPYVITVGAVNDVYNRAPFSNYGSCVDIFAPGQDIRTDNFHYPNPTTVVINGTSFSSPYVAGIAAYYLEAGLSTPADVKAALQQYGMKNLVADAQGSRNTLANNGYFNGLTKN